MAVPTKMLNQKLLLQSVSMEPPGWREASLPQLEVPFHGTCLTAQLINRKNLLDEYWFEATGHQAKDSAFTVVMPIHNEEKYLQSTLAALLCSHLPQSGNVQIVLVTNACTDRSCDIVKHFIGRLTDNEFKDMELRECIEPGITSSRKCNLHTGCTIVHVNTLTPGKANALTVANSIALFAGHEVSISLDANNWIEPTSIAILYKEAKSKLTGDAPMYSLLDGSPHPVHAESNLLTRSINTLNNIAPRGRDTRNHYICGWLLSWNPLWLKNIGGVPKTVTEDAALSFFARHNGHGLRHVEAGAWGYSPTTIGEIFETIKR